jgi:hypothetical protein
MALQHDWRQIIVELDKSQPTRARIRFDRCYHGIPLFDPLSPGGLGGWIWNVVYEWGSLIKPMTIQRGC